MHSSYRINQNPHSYVVRLKIVQTNVALSLFSNSAERLKYESKSNVNPKVAWPSGLRRLIHARIEAEISSPLEGVGSNPTAAKMVVKDDCNAIRLR